METIMEILAPLLAAPVAAIIAWLVAFIKAKAKFDIPASVHVKATELAVQAVTRAEELAKLQVSRMTSGSKAEAALSYLDNLASSDPELHRYITGKGKELIERVLISRLTPDEMTPHRAK